MGLDMASKVTLVTSAVLIMDLSDLVMARVRRDTDLCLNVTPPARSDGGHLS